MIRNEFFKCLQEESVILLSIVLTIISILIIIAIILIVNGIIKNKRVTEAALELKSVTDTIWAGLVRFVFEDDCRIIYASQGFYEMLGYSKNDSSLEGKESVLDFIHHEDKEKLINLINIQKDGKFKFEINLLAKDGGVITCFASGNKLRDKKGNHTISLMLVDFTEQKEMQARLLLETERYRVASELANDVLFEYDIAKDRVRYMGKYRELFGRKPLLSDFQKDNGINSKVIHPNDTGIYKKFCQKLGEGQEIIEVQFRMKDRLGEYIWCQVKGKTIYSEDGRPLRVIGTIININIHKREQEELEYRATRDPLTGVYNKQAIKKKVDMFIKGNKSEKHALLFIDFDNFKNVNDNFGHIQGDKILVKLADKIKKVFNDGEFVSRFGGDEFVVFIGSYDSFSEVRRKTRLLLEAMDTNYKKDGKTIELSGSIGVSIYPENGNNYSQLVECADQACYKVKANGKNNICFYEKAN